MPSCGRAVDRLLSWPVIVTDVACQGNLPNPDNSLRNAAAPEGGSLHLDFDCVKLDRAVSADYLLAALALATVPSIAAPTKASTQTANLLFFRRVS